MGQAGEAGVLVADQAEVTGDGEPLAVGTGMVFSGASGRLVETVRRDQELLAAAESVRAGRAVRVAEVAK